MSLMRALPAVVLALSATASAAKAETAWRFPYKGMPYVVTIDSATKLASNRGDSCSRVGVRATRKACYLR